MPPSRHAAGPEASRIVSTDWPHFGRTHLLVLTAKIGPMLALEREITSKTSGRRLCIADVRFQVETAAALSP